MPKWFVLNFFSFSRSLTFSHFCHLSSQMVAVLKGTGQPTKTSCDPFNGKQQQVSQTAIGTPGYAPPEHCIHLENKKAGASAAVALHPARPSSFHFVFKLTWRAWFSHMPTSDGNNCNLHSTSVFATWMSASRILLRTTHHWNIIGTLTKRTNMEHVRHSLREKFRKMTSLAGKTLGWPWWVRCPEFRVAAIVPEIRYLLSRNCSCGASHGRSCRWWTDLDSGLDTSHWWTQRTISSVSQIENMFPNMSTTISGLKIQKKGPDSSEY